VISFFSLRRKSGVFSRFLLISYFEFRALPFLIVIPTEVALPMNKNSTSAQDFSDRMRGFFPLPFGTILSPVLLFGGYFFETPSDVRC